MRGCLNTVLANAGNGYFPGFGTVAVRQDHAEVVVLDLVRFNHRRQLMQIMH